jgi:hypothetical protein
VVERLVHTEEVTGSNPVLPTIYRISDRFTLDTGITPHFLPLKLAMGEELTI